ncbi:hypothetical protein AMS68_007304 [Peltaster fructicola]|uniref:Uncharacterized protein n=1 Tax=Peltaster fructicola TaxID=286661 RepID=A0A6H0Y436_9PEZI|nr:hypothetical protein AMS68_007304 [Peltaster fructicola]
MVDKVNEALPNMAPGGPLGTQQKGLLSIVGDPLGKALDTTLKPTVGRLTGAIGQPTGEAADRVKQTARHEVGYSQEDNGKPDKELPGGESIGSKEQTGGNPLGL